MSSVEVEVDVGLSEGRDYVGDELLVGGLGIGAPGEEFSQKG